MSFADFKQRTYIEWQTKILAGFLASLSMSPKASQQLGEAAASLSIYGNPAASKASKAPTTDHLAPENGPKPEQPPASQSLNGEPRSGSFEKLMGIFGGGGAGPR